MIYLLIYLYLVEEYWKEIDGYWWYYKISSLWRIKSVNWILQPWKNSQGYLWIKFKNRKAYSIARLVARYFIGKSSLQVNHINGVKVCNAFWNIEYSTASENIKHSYKYLSRTITNKWNYGKDNHNSRKIIQVDNEWTIIKEWDSIADIERELKVLWSSIVKVCQGKYRHTKHLFFKYK